MIYMLLCVCLCDKPVLGDWYSYSDLNVVRLGKFYCICIMIPVLCLIDVCNHRMHSLVELILILGLVWFF